MSKKESFATIENVELAGVVGGLKVEGKGSLELGPGTGKVEGEVKYDRSNYESCVSAMTSRPGWTPAEVKDTCGLPPAN